MPTATPPSPRAVTNPSAATADVAPPSSHLDPLETAKLAHLRYVSDTRPGIRREPQGKEFAYFAPNGKPVSDEATLKRINALILPPAWTDVWICPLANGHLQATGRDAKGRKQYRYHARWREVRDEDKYGRMVVFGQALPKIRARVEEDLARKGMPREKVLAAVVRLLETTLIRVGNEEYAKSNHHYGLTTMHNRHAQVSGATVEFRFTGKSGKRHTIALHDRRLARIIHQLQELPGYELFEYEDESGVLRNIGSADVNAYLHEITGQDFTAKDFRTWAGTVLAAMALQSFEMFDSEAQAKKNITRAIESVSERLGNTPAVCRKCYVHPEVLHAYLDGTMLESLRQRVEEEISDSLTALHPEEAAVLAFLEARLAKESERLSLPRLA